MSNTRKAFVLVIGAGAVCGSLMGLHLLPVGWLRYTVPVVGLVGFGAAFADALDRNKRRKP